MRLTPTTYKKRHGHADRVEFATERRLRERNKLYYRLLHWPVWIFVFFIAPGPFTVDLFVHGVDTRILTWLAVVVIGTAVAGVRGRLPGVEPAPLILRFTEDRPNPLHRRVCYTLAWSEIVVYALLNAVGMVDALVNGQWRLHTIYSVWYFPIVVTVWLLGVAGKLPRAGFSTRGEWIERRYFYGSIWAVTIAQVVVWPLWRLLPQTRPNDVIKLAVFLGLLGIVGDLARRGRLPRTRPILPGETIVAD